MLRFSTNIEALFGVRLRAWVALQHFSVQFSVLDFKDTDELLGVVLSLQQ